MPNHEFQRSNVMRRLLLAVTAFSFLVGAPAAFASQCRDAQGKFMKCPAKSTVHCRDNSGKFVKCSAPGAKPA
jgi:hypothetical protein